MSSLCPDYVRVKTRNAKRAFNLKVLKQNDKMLIGRVVNGDGEEMPNVKPADAATLTAVHEWEDGETYKESRVWIPKEFIVWTKPLQFNLKYGNLEEAK